jgi:hypothetical protein
MDYNPVFTQFGGAFVGLIVGYLVSGFLICVLQTLPWHENFLDFEPRRRDEHQWRRYLPPDRVWLALMRHAGASPFSNRALPEPESDSLYDTYDTFDRDGAFEVNYLRHRRYNDNRPPVPYGRR